MHFHVYQRFLCLERVPVKCLTSVENTASSYPKRSPAMKPGTPKILGLCMTPGPWIWGKVCSPSHIHKYSFFSRIYLGFNKCEEHWERWGLLFSVYTGQCFGSRIAIQCARFCKNCNTCSTVYS